MIKLMNNPNLNINSWLINWGFLTGYVNNSKIQNTKYGPWIVCICILSQLFNLTKWTILLFNSKDSVVSHQLGDWGPFLGPKVILNSIIIIASIHLLNVVVLFYFCSKNPKKMFYWLEQMEFNVENGCFNKLDLNESDSLKMIKRMSLFISSFDCFTYLFIFLFLVVNFFALFKFQNDYYFNYSISIVLFVIPFYFYIKFSFGFIIILYLVSDD